MDDLPSLYRKGFIPGPTEDEEAFSRRVRLFRRDGGAKGDSLISKEEREKAFILTRSIYQVVPDWVEVDLTAEGLRFWEAGAAWEEADGRWKICLNSKQQLAEKTEVLGHEAIHAVRAAFDEKRFEEILAFRTSAKAWRRFFGPIVQRPREVWLLLLAVFFDSVCSFIGWMPCATLLMFSIWLIRLAWNQWRFSRCLASLACPALVICLTDREIVAMAKGETFSQLDDGSLRWRMINACASSLLEDASRFDT